MSRYVLLLYTRDSQHPRLKEPVGRRLAASLVSLHYGGNGTVTGPTIAGCTYDSTKDTIIVQFNKTLLGKDTVAITRTQQPIPPLPPVDPEAKHPPKPTRPGPVLDSSLTHVCTGDAEDCACLSWLHTPHPAPGNWTCEMPASNAGEPRSAQLTRGDIWTEVAIKLLPDKTAISIDTHHLNETTGGVHAIKFGWSEMQGSCCIDLLEHTEYKLPVATLSFACQFARDEYLLANATLYGNAVNSRFADWLHAFPGVAD